MTLLDLAVASDSKSFIETCCKKALDARSQSSSACCTRARPLSLSHTQSGISSRTDACRGALCLSDHSHRLYGDLDPYRNSIFALCFHALIIGPLFGPWAFAHLICQRLCRVVLGTKDSPPPRVRAQSDWFNTSHKLWFNTLHKLGLDQFCITYTLPPSAELLRGSTQV